MIIKYKAKNQDNKKVKGMVKVQNIEVFNTLITNANLTLISYKEVKKKLIVFEEKISYLELANFSKKLSLLLSTKISLDRALEIINKTTPHGRLKTLTLMMAKEIKKGNPMSLVLMECNNYFPRFFISMIKISETNGSLAETLNYLNNYYRTLHLSKQKIIGSLIYPSILSLFTILITILLLFVIIPRFKQIYDSMNIVKIPKITQIIFNLSSFCLNNYLWIILSICLIILIIILIANQKENLMMDKIRLKLPIHKKIIMPLIYTKLMYALWMIKSRGGNLVDGLIMVKDVINNKVIKKKLEIIHEDLKCGKYLSTSMEKVKVFTPMITDLLKIGEKTNSIEETLKILGEYYENESKELLNRLSQFIEPIIIVLIAIIVGVIILSVFLPMFGVMDQIIGE
ncbi:MAG: type II secretion system F family protein [Bacilli bacterium]|nr:type II secretion system F family protein [Bacilli bacterium]MDD7315356.1 type II secretion system F family protein [Bacilli bacterium]